MSKITVKIRVRPICKQQKGGRSTAKHLRGRGSGLCGSGASYSPQGRVTEDGAIQGALVLEDERYRRACEFRET